MTPLSMAPVPVTILSGFLGSGKTTLLNNLLRQQQKRRLAIIVNEFGDIGIDGQALREMGGDQQFVELENGCLCCAINEDLENTLHALRQKGGFEHLLIETTGIADPVPVAWTFSRPGLSDFYRVDAVVTVVDAGNFSTLIGSAHEVALQIERADILLLNKLDLVDDQGDKVRATLREYNELAPILNCVGGAIDWDLIIGSSAAYHQNTWAESASMQKTEGTRHHHTKFVSWSFLTEQVLSDEALEDLFYELPSNVYRVKGVVRTDAEWEWTLVNVVAGRFTLLPFLPPEKVPQISPKGAQKRVTPLPTKSALVFIGQELDTTVLEKLCDKLV